MSGNLLSDTRRYYRNRGLRPLVRSVTSDVFRVVPLRYRVAYRYAIGRMKYGSRAVAPPLKTYRVSPDRIRYNGPVFKHSKYVGRRLDGDWDRNPSELTSEWMYLGLHERFAKGHDWEETRYYERSKEKIDSGHVWLGYDSFESFESKRLPYLDTVYERIKEEGYKEQSDISADDRDPIRDKRRSRIDEVTCNIGRDGRLLLNDGMHRISIAKILGIDELPIQIIARHTDWQRKLTTFARSESARRAADRYGIDPAHPDLGRMLQA